MKCVCMCIEWVQGVSQNQMEIDRLLLIDVLKCDNFESDAATKTTPTMNNNGYCTMHRSQSQELTQQIQHRD